MAASNASTEKMSKKSKKIIEEPESCLVCMNNYTPIIRKKCVCKYCKADSCSKCIERYLLEKHEDAHCLHCRVNYTDAALHEICTKTYLQQTYFKHRQEVLVNRERANLPALQDAALEERKKRAGEQRIAEIREEIKILDNTINDMLNDYNKMYVTYYETLTQKNNADEVRKSLDLRKNLDSILANIDKLRGDKRFKEDVINRIRWPNIYGGAGDRHAPVKPPEEEKKKFIRRCTRDGCQGFLSTAWKCGICEYYSCNKCFITKTKNHDDPHECKKEDVETADLIKKDSKPCPNCGEFIMKSSGCSQMWCITCQTPWDWNTGKVVAGGIIHNPHYYEWMKRNGGAAPRNPADVPCGGYPNGWELVRMPRGLNTKVSNKFYEFHRICQEIQDISGRTYRSHIDNTLNTNTNIKFLLGDYDEKRWGQNLAKNEKKRKRDNEVQEIFGAYRMIAVELINRVQNYREDKITSFSFLPIPTAEKFLTDLYVEIDALITMINDALRSVSISYNYSVPYIVLDGMYFSIKTKNFSDEVKKKRGTKKAEEAEEADNDNDTVSTASSETKRKKPQIAPDSVVEPQTNTVVLPRRKPTVAPSPPEPDSDNDAELQMAIQSSLGI